MNGAPRPGVLRASRSARRGPPNAGYAGRGGPACAIELSTRDVELSTRDVERFSRYSKPVSGTEDASPPQPTRAIAFEAALESAR